MKKLFTLLLLLPFLLHAQIITTIAGIGIGVSSGDGGSATAAHLFGPSFGSFDSMGNYYFGEAIPNPKVRRVDLTNIINSVAGTGISGFSGDGGAASIAKIAYSVTKTDKAGNIYIADYYNRRVRRVDSKTGIINTIAGNGTSGSSGDGGPATAAVLVPIDLGLDSLGDLYISDSAGGLRKINSSGVISKVSSIRSSGNGICLDGLGNIYLSCDTRILKLNFATGKVDTVAGTGVAVYSGDGIPATTAQFKSMGLALDATGNIFIADWNQRIRKIDNAGIIHTVVGTGTSGFAGDGGPATSAQIYNPMGLTFDVCGNLYIADGANYRIRKISFPSPAASIILLASPNDTVCAGTTVTFTANSSGGGYAPTYKWYLNGAVVSTTGSSYTYIPAHKDSIRCVLTSSCSGLSANSNSVHMVVDPVIPTGITITVSPDDTLCKGTAAAFTATTAGGGSTPAFQWYVNGTPVVSGISTYSYTPANGDLVFCELTSSSICASPAVNTSNTIAMQIDTNVTPAIYLTGSGATPVGGTVTVMATIAGIGGSSYVIHWFNNGTLFATTTTPSVTYTKITSVDTITARIVISSACHDSTEAEGVIVPDFALSSTQLPGTTTIIYPNPAYSVLYVGGIAGSAAYRLSGIVGAVVREGVLGHTNAGISLDGLPVGMYLLEVSCEDGGWSVMKVVKR